MASVIIQRNLYQDRVHLALQRSPITAILGPRQCGKTTLARQIAQNQQSVNFDIESQADIRRLQNPEMMFLSLSGLVIIDEIQLMPELFSVLRVVVDNPQNRCRFLILGSASPQIIKNTSETLAGRIEFIDMAGFNLQEIGCEQWKTLWIRGGFPRSYLAQSEPDSIAWREGFIRTFLQRDIGQLGIGVSPAAMRKFWMMLAHYHGQTWNASRIAASMGISDKTVRSYLDILTETYMIRQIQPWHENIGKRQVKSCKIYFRDTGLLHSLLNLEDYHAITGHPLAGASWEGFAMEQVLELLHPAAAYYWATYGESEIDLFFMMNNRRYGVEFKFSEAPIITRSMRLSMETLRLDKLFVVYPGNQEYPVDSNILVCPPGTLKMHIQ
jgi:predicted AAA+ superfamily ATPase